LPDANTHPDTDDNTDTDRYTDKYVSRYASSYSNAYNNSNIDDSIIRTNSVRLYDGNKLEYSSASCRCWI
jgi:hypothetical protein